MAAAAGGGNIKVVVRVRPFNNRENERNAKCIVSMQGDQTTLTPPSGDSKPKNNKAALETAKTFAFDKSYWSFDRKDSNFAGQSNVFDDLGSPLLDNAFQGYNNCIFAYGQTGSGKSYSMMGFGEELGIIPRICKNMFERIDDLQSDKNTTCTVEVSYLEIYNERVRDLLNPANKGHLKVREHPSTGPYVEDLAKLLVRSFKEIENLMDEGNKARTVAATNMNETSSRSHAVFTLTLTQKKHDEDTKMDMERVAKISLVDLAGSERANSTGATGARLKEGAEINRSLSTLGRVIAALADLSSGKKKNASLVPYRDSVLTWLLKDSLGGNSMTAMIAAISPADINFEETLSTLRYADSAKRIKNHAVVNEDANARMIRELKEELAQLRAKLSGGGVIPAGAAAGTVGSGVEYPPGTPLEQQMVTITQADGSTKQVSKAEIAEQLSQSEKLYSDLNQTWEQKLQKTEEIHREREAALEELGISIEKGFVGMSTPKKMPHLVNLSDDPLLAECLVYNLKPGTTTVGNDEMTTTAEIRLKGSKILQEHCTFENENGSVSIVPNDDAAVMVNGLRVEQRKRLHSGYRIILGDFHIFRFNNPEEARAERAGRGSMLKHSTTADEIDSSDVDAPSHSRARSSISRAGSDTGTPRLDRDSSPAYMASEQEYDWSFARREAARAILGPDQKISNLTDEELDILFEDLQRVRANRRNPRENRLLDGEDDSDSNTSYPVRDRYLSSLGHDNGSLDTALTAPSTPPNGEDRDLAKNLSDELQPLAEKQTSSGLSSRSSSDGHVSEREAERIAYEKNLQKVKEEMESQMQKQKEEYERKLEQFQPASTSHSAKAPLTMREKSLAKDAVHKWQQRKYVRMAGQMLQHVSLLKEAQILSQQIGKTVVFQFAIIDAGQSLGSSYDLVLNGMTDETDDDELLMCPKPCVGVRVVDFKHHVVSVWSLDKLETRVQRMRQMQQFLDRPEYVRHFRIDNPFSDSNQPQYSRIGESQVSLAAVWESRVQDYVVDVISPFTFSVVGILKLSLEPSLAEAPESTMKFNVILHDLAGFAEMEGTDVHAQLSIPRVSEEGGATTTQLIKDFNEGPVRFESLHGMSLPLSSSHDCNLRVSLFARVTPMHLDKLLSWDDMRDSAFRRQSFTGSRIAETEFHTEEKHDLFTSIQILELSESGEYEPVDLVQMSSLDPGTFQLHQGLQRRIVIEMTHSGGENLPWEHVASVRIGKVHLVDVSGRPPDIITSQLEVPLKLLATPSTTHNPDGTTNISLTGQWDSSAHSSVLLDRTTAEKYRIHATLYWEVYSTRLNDALRFSMDFMLQVRPRAFIRAPSVLSQLWQQTKPARSMSSIFVITTKPSPIESSNDLWRMDTQYEYVKGEENLSNWAPRGVSLIRDFINYRRQQIRAADVEMTKSIFGSDSLTVEDESRDAVQSTSSEEQKQVLQKFVNAWKSNSADPSTKILSDSNVEPPQDGVTGKSQKSNASCKISATVHHQAKNPSLLKSGYLLMPDSTQARWIRRFLELRRPYLHVYSVPEGDELNAINLHDSRVDHQPQIAKLLRKTSAANAQLNVFAIYARQNSFLFATRSEREKVEWVLRLDESYLGNGSGSNSDQQYGL